jgi:hypothetical protein
VASPTSKSISLRVENLARYYANLARALTETGISGSQLNEILSTRLQARCVQCDIPITSDEIEQVSLVEDPTQLSHPKLKRLRLGDCARDCCASRDYRILLEACPGVDWETIAAKAGDLMAAEQAATKEAERRRIKEAQYQRRRRAALGLLILTFAFLLLFVMRNGRLPFVKKPHKYEIDPASVGHQPGR